MFMEGLPRDGVEGQRRLARAGEPGDDDELIARQLEIDGFEMCSRARRTTIRSLAIGVR
jgi:hypothetical protein